MLIPFIGYQGYCEFCLKSIHYVFAVGNSVLLGLEAIVRSAAGAEALTTMMNADQNLSLVMAINNDERALTDARERFDATENNLFAIDYPVALNSDVIATQGQNIWSVGQQDCFGKILFSRKVFIGGLPPFISINVLTSFFAQFGENKIDWPYRRGDMDLYPPNGLFTAAFLSVQIKPWLLSDRFYISKDILAISERYSVFVGGVPRTARAR
ncbi:unnamed protein product [Gongylonema pulchrum]|uniref:RRM domain-containing protein n=1 Tax=Gongylonema pulchrum TaxID=637853 RepID=A0A183EGA0_9BILA|nr:unnamed protein product [Gongylonema pulchrum]